MPDAIAFCFPEVAKGTEAEAAFFDICEIDAAARCDVLWHEIYNAQHVCLSVLGVRSGFSGCSARN